MSKLYHAKIKADSKNSSSIVIINETLDTWPPNFINAIKARGETREENSYYRNIYKQAREYYKNVVFEVISPMLYKNRKIKLMGHFKMQDGAEKKRVIRTFLENLILLKTDLKETAAKQHRM
jgi:hypothetical protein